MVGVADEEERVVQGAGAFVGIEPLVIDWSPLFRSRWGTSPLLLVPWAPNVASLLGGSILDKLVPPSPVGSSPSNSSLSYFCVFSGVQSHFE